MNDGIRVRVDEVHDTGESGGAQEGDGEDREGRSLDDVAARALDASLLPRRIVVLWALADLAEDAFVAFGAQALGLGRAVVCVGSESESCFSYHNG